MQTFKNVILLLCIWNKNSHLASHLLVRTQNQNKNGSLLSSQDSIKYECIKGAKFCTKFWNLISLWICFKVLALRLLTSTMLLEAGHIEAYKFKSCDIYALVKIINKTAWLTRNLVEATSSSNPRLENLIHS